MRFLPLQSALGERLSFTEIALPRVSSREGTIT